MYTSPSVGASQAAKLLVMDTKSPGTSIIRNRASPQWPLLSIRIRYSYTSSTGKRALAVQQANSTKALHLDLRVLFEYIHHATCVPCCTVPCLSCEIAVLLYMSARPILLLSWLHLPLRQPAAALVSSRAAWGAYDRS